MAPNDEGVSLKEWCRQVAKGLPALAERAIDGCVTEEVAVTDDIHTFSIFVVPPSIAAMFRDLLTQMSGSEPKVKEIPVTHPTEN